MFNGLGPHLANIHTACACAKVRQCTRQHGRSTSLSILFLTLFSATW